MNSAIQQINHNPLDKDYQIQYIVIYPVDNAIHTPFEHLEQDAVSRIIYLKVKRSVSAYIALRLRYSCDVVSHARWSDEIVYLTRAQSIVFF